MNEIAATITEQLGGLRLLKMLLGVTNVVFSNDGVSYKFKARARSGINYFRVKLNGNDLYDVEFYSVRGGKATLKASHGDIYCDQLQGLVADTTGLCVSF